MFAESELLPLSGLAQLAYCERRCALVHLEQQWEENRFTAEGRGLHERAHEPETEVRGDMRIVRALRLRSLWLGLVGVADVVEFHRLEEPEALTGTGAPLPGTEGLWRPFPVEYKRGRPRPERCSEVQLCAQALCLEEMLGAPVSRGALFSKKSQRRIEVVFDEFLRRETEVLAARLHDLIASGRTPPPVYERKCKSCSLLPRCLPQAVGARRSVSAYVAHFLEETTDSGEVTE